MNMEEFILSNAFDYIESLCKYRWTSIPKEDRCSEAMLCMLCALRMLPTESPFFLAFFERCLEPYMAACSRSYRGQSPAGLSLNARYGRSDAELGSYIADPSTDNTAIPVLIFMRLLPAKNRRLIEELSWCKNADRKNVARKYGYSLKQMNGILRHLYEKYACIKKLYNGLN